MKIVLASRNAHKIKELQTLLSQYIADIEILSLDDVGIFDEIEENGSTYLENAMIKAKAAAKSGYIGMGDDSGLSVRALDGAPGIYSARYSGGDYAANNELLLKNLEGVSDRFAEFVCTIACVFPDGRQFTVRGECHGHIAFEESGNCGFGYDPLFISEKGCFGHLSAEEKDSISHRGKALRLFKEELSKYI